MASTEEIRADLAEIVNEVAGVDADDVQLDKSFVDDLDVDSLSMVEVVVAAEEKFGVTIPDDDTDIFHSLVVMSAGGGSTTAQSYPEFFDEGIDAKQEAETPVDRHRKG